MSGIDAGGLSRSRRMAVIASLYLVTDIGYSFLFLAVTTILLERGVDLGTVALLNLLGTFYFARFLVSPVVDRFGWGRHGHYRTWLAGTQVLLVLALVALAGIDPVDDLRALVGLMVVVLVVSLFHDNAINGLMVRILVPADHGPANGIQMAAASLSVVIGSGGALLLHSRCGWTTTVLCLAAVYLVPLAVLARFAEPPAPPAEERPAPWWVLVTFFRQRRSVVWTLGVIPLVLLGDWLVGSLVSPMLLAAGWTSERIAAVLFTAATGAQVLASLVTGVLINRVGRRRVVVVIGVTGAAASAVMLPVSLGYGALWPVACALVVVTACYGAKMTWISTVSLGMARDSTGSTDFTVPMSMTGVGRVVVTSAALGLAGAVGYTWLVGVAVALALAAIAPAVAASREPAPEPQPAPAG